MHKIIHYIYDSGNINIDIELYIFFSIKSIIEICNPDFIYFYYINLPIGKLWNNIKTKLTLKKINIPFQQFDKYKKSIIYKNLINIGGIYIDKYTLLINSIDKLFSYNFIKSTNDEIICCHKNSNLVIKNHDDIILNYNNSYDNIYNFIFKEIIDYSFGDYFYLIKNCYFINIENNKNNLQNINLYDIFNKITIYNLLIRHILIYNIIKNEIYYNNINNNSKLYLINNIDVIYWINLEKSLYRRSKMTQILNNFHNIQNIRINAYDGSNEENIKEKYFYCTSNIYPKYSNKEYAILLSHLTAIETYLNTDSNNNKYGIALICEDDLSLDFINYWNIDIKTLVENAPVDWDILMLGYFSLNINRKKLYEKWNNEWSAISYLIKYENIHKINNLKINNKWICNENDLMVSDNYIFSKLNTYVYKYPFFTFPNNNNSTLHHDHLDYHKIYKISNYITLENIYELYCD
jgi:hypothetical protein